MEKQKTHCSEFAPVITFLDWFCLPLSKSYLFGRAPRVSHLFPTLRFFLLFLPESLTCALEIRGSSTVSELGGDAKVPVPTPDPLHLGLGLSSTSSRALHVVLTHQSLEPTPGPQSHLLEMAVPPSLSSDQHISGLSLTVSKTQSPGNSFQGPIRPLLPLCLPDLHVPSAHCPVNSATLVTAPSDWRAMPGLLLPQHLHWDGTEPVTCSLRSAWLGPSLLQVLSFLTPTLSHTTYN